MAKRCIKFHVERHIYFDGEIVIIAQSDRKIFGNALFKQKH